MLPCAFSSKHANKVVLWIYFSHITQDALRHELRHHSVGWRSERSRRKLWMANHFLLPPHTTVYFYSVVIWKTCEYVILIKYGFMESEVERQRERTWKGMWKGERERERERTKKREFNACDHQVPERKAISCVEYFRCSSLEVIQE